MNPALKLSRKTRYRIALLVGSLGLSLVGVEVVLRLVFPTAAAGIRVTRYLESERSKFCRYSDTLGWEGIPNVANSFEYVDSHCNVRQNGFGFRGVEFNQNVAMFRRIVVLGDSFVWGFGVNDDETFTQLMLHQASPPIEVVNLGVSGYGTDQQLLLWEAKGREWKPDDVLLVMDVTSDLYDNMSAVRYGYQKPLFRFDAGGKAELTNVPVPREFRQDVRRRPTPGRATGLMAGLMEHSDLACVVVRVLVKVRFIRESFERQHLVLPARIVPDMQHELFKLPSDDQTVRAWKVMTNLVGLLNLSVKQSGARLTIAVVPASVQVYPDLWERFLQKPNSSGPGDFTLDRTLPGQRLRDFAQSSQIGFIDLLPDFQAAARTNGSLYFPANGHWTRVGNQLTAEVILREMGKR